MCEGPLEFTVVELGRRFESSPLDSRLREESLLFETTRKLVCLSQDSANLRSYKLSLLFNIAGDLVYALDYFNL